MSGGVDKPETFEAASSLHMRLRSISISNFRSIIRSSKIPLSELTVLLGPNNEGKSNVIRALAIALRAALELRPRAFIGAHAPDYVYDWERDFPISLQATRPGGVSTFVLEFELSEKEEKDFHQTVGSKVKTPLPLEIQIGADRRPLISVRKKGRNSTRITLKRQQISAFLAERLDITYIPAIRTAEEAERVVTRLIARELQRLEGNEEFTEALSRVKKFQQPILDEVAAAIAETLRQFLPAVESVQLVVPEHRRSEALRRADVLVDDGTLTELRYKGDGVQSLATLALLKFAAERDAGQKDVVLALEEPESHLHPLAIRELFDVVRILSQTQQVVITTHCPLFVDRQKLGSNVLVQKGRARPAKTIAEVREILGVRPSDNLQHAEIVLVVEGEDDRIAILSILRDRSTAIRDAIRHNRLAVDTLHGASNLAYKLGLLRDALCRYVCFLDFDEAGKRAVAAAKAQALLSDSDVTYARVLGRQECEFEDVLKVELVHGVLSQNFGISTFSLPKSAKNLKWSDRMKQLFVQSGKAWDSGVEMLLKVKVAEAVSAQPKDAIMAVCEPIFTNLVQVLENQLASSRKAVQG